MASKIREFVKKTTQQFTILFENPQRNQRGQYESPKLTQKIDFTNIDVIGIHRNFDHIDIIIYKSVSVKVKKSVIYYNTTSNKS